MNFDFDFEDDLIAKDVLLEMKCVNCGYECKMPDFIYDEEAAFSKRPCFACYKCNKDALYLKDIALSIMGSKNSKR